MAGDWIKFELNTLDKPEVCQIADLADLDPDAVVGKLMRVWGWFDQQTEDGNAPSVTKKLLDRLVGVSGFCEHMKSVAWMVEEDGVISLPHFDRHNGKTAKNRALTAKRVAGHKASNAKGNAPSVSSALPREEKRREDINPSHTPHATSDDLPPGVIAMHLEWQPDPKTLAAYAKRAGLDISLFTPDAIGPFVVHHSAKATVKPETEFVSALVNWIKRDQVQGARVVPLRARQANGANFDDTATGWLGE